MNLLEMYKQLTDKEKEEFIELILAEVNKKITKNGNQTLVN